MVIELPLKRVLVTGLMCVDVGTPQLTPDKRKRKDGCMKISRSTNGWKKWEEEVGNGRE